MAESKQVDSEILKAQTEFIKQYIDKYVADLQEENRLLKARVQQLEDRSPHLEKEVGSIYKLTMWSENENQMITTSV